MSVTTIEGISSCSDNKTLTQQFNPLIDSNMTGLLVGGRAVEGGLLE